MTGALRSAGPVLVRQKVMPPGLPGAVIIRPRLHRLFEDLLTDREALAVFASAGSGKTVQAQLYADHRNVPLAWLSLDRGDRSPTRMLSYLAASLSPHVLGAESAVEHALSQTSVPEEAAAVLAEVVDIPALLVVIDQCEEIAESARSCSVLETFLDYLPQTARVILLGRSELPFSLGRLVLHGRVGRITDDDLALTVEEAESLLKARNDGSADVRARWTVAQGWVAGVAFGGEGRPGDRNRARDFGSYISSEIIELLPPDERQFLLDTSILEAVSMRAATALCGPHARAVWRRISQRHLPATTSVDRNIVYHPCFRSYLREQLELDDPDRLQVLQRRYASLLVESGRHEEAVDALLAIGLADDAVEPAERASRSVTDRGDWEVVLRWGEQLTAQRLNDHPRLLGARIRALRGTRRLSEVRDLARQLDRTGRLTRVAAEDPGVIAHIAWSMLWQPAEALHVLRHDPDGSGSAGVRYLLEATSLAVPCAPPTELHHLETDRLVSWGLLVQGRLDELVAMVPGEQEWPPRNPYTTPHPLLGLVWRGEVSRARELFDQVADHIKRQAHTDLWQHLEAWILLAEGDAAAALAAAERSVIHSRSSGFGFEPVFQVAQGQALIALGRIDDAAEVLRSSATSSTRSGLVAYVEWAEALLGRTLLLRGEEELAAELLRRSTTGMRRAERRLLLPLAAIYLSEVEQRLGDLEAADTAAEVAYAAARAMGAFRALQMGLEDCPAVHRRQLRRDPLLWREVSGLSHGNGTPRPSSHPRSSRPAPVPPKSGVSVEDSVVVVDLRPFGENPDIVVNGQPAPVRRLKLLELSCLLASRPEGVSRNAIQLQLFPDSDRRKGSNHFRQVVHQLRKMTGLTLRRLPNAHITWSENTDVDATDLRFERILAEARALFGGERLKLIRQALDLVDGSYLPASDLEWVGDRRFRLEVLQEEAETEGARLSLEVDDFGFARACAEALLARNPYSEPAYRTVMQVELAVGTETAALAVYRRAVAALREVGLEPGPEMAGLLQRHNPLRGSSVRRNA